MDQVQQPQSTKVIDIERVSQRLREQDTCSIIEHDFDLFGQFLPDFRVKTKAYEGQVTFDRNDLFINPLLEIRAFSKQGLKQLRGEYLFVDSLSKGNVWAWTDH